MGTWGYEKWSSELDRYYLREPADHPIVFCVDVETLADLTGENGQEAADALASCVASQVMPGYRFRIVVTSCERWANGDRQNAPPSLPLLAVTVLAASQMDRSAAVGAHNYYRRFRQLLDPSDTQPGMPGDYGSTIPRLWQQLERWLNDELCGHRGILTLPSEEVLARTR